MKTELKALHRAAPFLIGGAVTALAAVPASAQTTPDPAADEIVVSGYSGSLQKAIDMKRDTIGFSDSIIATDIADFPDQNLSEALQRHHRARQGPGHPRQRARSAE